MIDAWIAHMKWDASPIRALGPQTWLVRANAELPEAVPMFNATPILARLLPPRDAKAPEKVLLGPRPKAPAKTSADPWHQKPGHDPWANWTPPSRPETSASSIPQRPVQGPMENKFAEQDEKLATMQKSIDQLTNQQQQHVQQVEQQFQVAAQREKENMAKVDHAIKNIEKSVESALAQSMRSHTQAMDERFKELKQLLAGSNKRPAPDEGDQLMD